MMGMEHERIHVETSSVLIRQLPVTMVQPPPQWVTAPHSHGRLWCGLLVNGLLRIFLLTLDLSHAMTLSHIEYFVTALNYGCG